MQDNITLQVSLKADVFEKANRNASEKQVCVEEYIENFGSKMHMWRVGRAYAAMKLREINGIFGGELAGHYYFKDFYYSDSGIMASLIILGVLSKMKKKGISFSQLIGNIAKYANSGEINFEIEKKSEAMEQIKNHFTFTVKGGGMV